MPNIFLIFLATLVFAPLAFGSVEQWSLALIECVAPAALCAFLLLSGSNDNFKFRQTPGIIPLGCLTAYILFQAIPLPAELVRLISPGSYAVYAGSAGVTGQLAWIPISVHPKATVSEFMRVGAYAAFYVLTVQLLSDGKYLKRTVVAITLLGAALALFGMFQAFLSNGKIYWVRTIVTGNFFGPFTNRNHFAGLMAMIIPVALGLFVALKPTVVYGSLRDRLSVMLNQKQMNNHILIGIATVIMATSVFLTLSRGGIISLCAAIAFFYLLLLFRKKGKHLTGIVLLICIIIVLIVGWFGWSHIAGRFHELEKLSLTEAGSLDRITIWKNSLAAIKDFPLTGSGFGSFSSIYPQYAAEWADMQVLHAHNDYIELAAEGGTIAFGLAIWFLGTVLYRTVRIIPERKDDYSICIYTGSLAGIFALLVFSLSDFNMHIGSNALYFYFLAGLAVAASHTRLHKGLEPTYLIQYAPSKIRPALFIVSAFLITGLIFNLGILAARYCFSPLTRVKHESITDTSQLAALGGDARRAILFDPLEARYYYTAGVIERRLSNIGDAVNLLDRAVSLDPMNSEYMQRLGLALYRNGQTEAGDRLIRAGTLYDIANPARYKFYAIHLFSTGRSAEAVDLINRTLAIAPQQAEDLILLMMLRGQSDHEIKRALPERAAPHLAYANYLAQSGKQQEADDAYRVALYYASREKRPDRAVFIKIFHYYVKRELFDAALYAARQGIAVLPDDSELHYDAGMIYEKLNMDAAAVGEYKKAVDLDIANTDAGRRLDALSRRAVKP